MIENISQEQLAEALQRENPAWPADIVERQAAEYISVWDNRFSTILNEYITKGIETDYQHGDFSVLHIKALRHNCGYLHAINLMDIYIKDPENGEAFILRR